jgi:hypothetical protein
MDARLLRLAMLALSLSSLGASYRTRNFVVSAPSQDLAEEIGKAAEKYRRELAIDWLGKEMPNWSQPCPITAQVAEHLGAGGATSFVFDKGEVFGWRMTIQGSHVRILDSVLPHEVMHTVFATHFRQPLPRWADEGACTTVEHVSERSKQQNMLIEFLRTGKGLAFTRMFAMKDYPADVMPLYSEGYSVARFLIAQGGKQRFLEFVGDGLRDENWTRATREHYGATSLAALQNQWLDWVRQGSPKLDSRPEAALAAASGADRGDRKSRPGPRPQDDDVAASSRPKKPQAAQGTTDGSGPSIYELAATDKSVLKRGASSDEGQWRSPRAGSGDASDEPGDKLATRGKSNSDSAAVSEPPIPSPVPYQVTRPQDMERPRQIILEWSRPHQGSPGNTSSTGQAAYGVPGTNS